MRAILSVFILTAAIFITGCNGTRYLGQVGDVKYYKVHANNFSGPSITALVSLSNNVTKVESIMQTSVSVSTGPSFQPFSGTGTGFMPGSTSSSGNSSCPSGNCYYQFK